MMTLPPGVKRTKLVRTRDFGIVNKVALDTGGSLQFTLDQVPGQAEITALYDAYSIDKVEIHFVWSQPTQGAAPGASVAPLMLCTRDYDDALPPVTYDTVGEYADASLLVFGLANNHHVVTVQPRVAKTLFRTGVTSAYGWGAQSEIIDAANIDVPHYGLKWFTRYYNSTGQPDSFINIHIKYYLSGYAQR